ncbi:MAG TPA: 2OG-Fe(II) oxygenase family protein [Parachlamydiaceae bacterium]|nr:2OG-Fe(II) oxygenase family protein [Parachlamydiaceae bacterium]
MQPSNSFDSYNQYGPQSVYSVSEIKEQQSSFSNIPVIDISKFECTETRNEFLTSLEKGLKFGFFAVVNPELDINTIEKGYEAFGKFFKSSKEEKMAINKPDLRGQRGYLYHEIALGNTTADSKEYLHIGSKNSNVANVWPTHMDLEGPAMALFDKLKEIGQPILRGIALVLGQREDFFTEMTDNGENLMRALHYYKNPLGGVWAAEHTDIDLLTILPYASEKGLEIEVNGKWEQVVVPKNALVINVGDMLEAFSNGFPSCKHRVRSTTPDTERESVVFFIHPQDGTMIRPLENEKQIHKYPKGTRLDYLFLRLFSNGQLTESQGEEVIKGKFVKRIEQMVKAGTAADSVKLWYEGFQKSVLHIQMQKLNDFVQQFEYNTK